MKKHFFLLLTFFFILQLGSSIKFFYLLRNHQVQCFHESAQIGTRYQLEIRANASQYYLHVNEQKIVHQDSRLDQFFKYYSAFANSNVGVTFCIGNLHVQQIIELQIEFYHGFYLEDDSRMQGQNAFMDLSLRLSQMSNMIQMNYDKYKKEFIHRQKHNQYLTMMTSFMVVLFMIIIAVVKGIFFNRMVKYMKYRKII